MSWVSREYLVVMCRDALPPMPYQGTYSLSYERPLGEYVRRVIGQLIGLAADTARPSVLVIHGHPELRDRIGIVCEALSVDLDDDGFVTLELDPKWRAVPGYWTDQRELYRACQIESELMWDMVDAGSREKIDELLAFTVDIWSEQGRTLPTDVRVSPTRVLYAALGTLLGRDDPDRITALLGTPAQQLQICTTHMERRAPRITPSGDGRRQRGVPGSTRSAESSTPPVGDLIVVRAALARFGRDLSALAAAGELAPAFGRDAEIDRAIRTLMQVEKNNPVFVGPPGVGKSAIAAGVACRIDQGAVPPSLRESVMVEVDITSLVQGTKVRGDFEERLAEVLRLARDPRVILFIDEIHRIVSAGAAMDTEGAGEALKPSLCAW